MNTYRVLAALCIVTFVVSAAEAQTLTVYDDALQNIVQRWIVCERGIGRLQQHH